MEKSFGKAKRKKEKATRIKMHPEKQRIAVTQPFSAKPGRSNILVKIKKKLRKRVAKRRTRMAFGAIKGEDEYWEKIREERENGGFFGCGDNEPERETGWIFLDGKRNEIEKEYGCGLEDLFEADLLDIVERESGTEAEEAKWDGKMNAIEYRRTVKC